MLKSFIKAEGHLCLFLPKFHCELNPIEMVSVLLLFKIYSTDNIQFSTGVGASIVTVNIPGIISQRLKSVPTKFLMPAQRRSFRSSSTTHGGL